MLQKEISPQDGEIKGFQSWKGKGWLPNVPFLFMVILIYVVSYLVFGVSCILPASIFSLTIRLVSGFITIIVVPGIVATSIILPREVQGLDISLLMGFIIQILGIHLLYTLSLLFGYIVPLIYEVLALSITSTFAGFLYIHTNRPSHKLEDAIRFESNQRLFYLVVIALVIRIGMLLAADGCLAPDASLYADYARNLINGQFSSSALNDGAVHHLTETVDYITHHAFTYVFAISWLLIPPAISGPVFILTFVGILLILPVYTFTRTHFGESVAIYASGVLAIHPLFVFHSAVGYGPEITSLLFLVFAAFLIVDGDKIQCRTLFLSGLLLGLVDVTWYANFYVACFALPAIAIYKLRLLDGIDIVSIMLLPIVAIARLFFTNWIMFYGTWLVIFSLLAYYVSRKPDFNLRKEISFLSGIAAIMIAWRWPLQLDAVYSGASSKLIQTIPLVEAALSPNILQAFPGFIFFSIFHLSPGLLILGILSFLRGTKQRISAGFAIVGLITSVGTLMVLSTISGSLQIIYIFSDSRYFLLITLMFLVAGAGYIAHIFRDSKHSPDGQEQQKMRILQRKSRLITALIIIGLVPPYLLMPTGLTLINMEDRYGWKDLSSIVDPLGDENAIFLANRVREFSWFTGRKCAFLEFSSEGLNYLNASLELVSLATNFSVQYLLIDDYTIAKWKTLEFLLFDPFTIGDSIDLNASYIDELQSHPNITLARLTLVGETEANIYGRQSRVFSLDMLNPIDLHANFLQKDISL